MKTASFLSFVFLLAACAAKPDMTPIAYSSLGEAYKLAESYAKAANRCWFEAKPQEFSRYKIASELDSLSGRPRLLIVPKNRPTDRPLLVIQTQNNDQGSVNVDVYGPLLGDEKIGSIVRQDVEVWKDGRFSCA